MMKEKRNLFDLRDFMWFIQEKHYLPMEGQTMLWSRENDWETYREAVGVVCGRDVQGDAGRRNTVQKTLKWHIPQSRPWYALIVYQSTFDFPLPMKNLPADKEAWIERKETKHLSIIRAVFCPSFSILSLLQCFSHMHTIK